MNVSTLIILAFYLIMNGVAADSAWPPKMKWVDQRVDHFSYSNEPCFFKQRYFYDDSHWKRPNGPIFFYTGNRGPLESLWNNTGLPFDLASHFGALVVFGEHRYYGQSMPFGADSLKQPGIKYLSVSQALADFAFMIDHVKARFSANDSPVISFGGSYGGMLTAYMRSKYPNKVHGAVASSAPISWMSGKGKLHQFFESVTKSFKDVDNDCLGRLSDAFKTIDDMAQKDNYAIIKTVLHLCRAPSSTQEVRHLHLWLRAAFATLAINNYPFPTNSLPANPIQAACQIDDNRKFMFNTLMKVVETVHGKKSCYDPWAEFRECADATGCGTGDAAKARDFQACTEVLSNDPSGPTTDIFPNLGRSAASVAAYCRKTFGVEPGKNLQTLFGGGDIGAASNILFTNGNLDPWHSGGVLQDLSSLVKSHVIEGGAHQSDMRPSNPQDPKGVKAARHFEVKLITGWIKEHK